MKNRSLKTIAPILLTLTSLTLLTSCGSSAPTSVTKEQIVVSSPTVTEILDEKTAEADSINPAESSDESGTETEVSADTMPDDNSGESLEAMPESPASGVDIDLTALSATARYGQVYNMMYYPENFVGKTIRMEGMYTQYLDLATGKRHFACIIMDATACCAQGIEFNPAEQYTFPDDFPSEGDTITVEGTFDLYDEDGTSYCTLRNATLLSISD